MARSNSGYGSVRHGLPSLYIQTATPSTRGFGPVTEQLPLQFPIVLWAVALTVHVPGFTSPERSGSRTVPDVRPPFYYCRFAVRRIIVRCRVRVGLLRSCG